MKKVQVWKVDPVRKCITVQFLPGGKTNFKRPIAKMLGTDQNQVDHKVLLDDGEVLLAVAANALAEDSDPGWRLKGQKVTSAGPCILFGVHRKEGFKPCPQTKVWLEMMIEWLTPEQMMEAAKLEAEALDDEGQ